MVVTVLPTDETSLQPAGFQLIKIQYSSWTLNSMVYPGRPSRGCHLCKKRKIKVSLRKQSRKQYRMQFHKRLLPACTAIELSLLAEPTSPTHSSSILSSAMKHDQPAIAAPAPNAHVPATSIALTWSCAIKPTWSARERSGKRNKKAIIIRRIRPM